MLMLPCNIVLMNMFESTYKESSVGKYFSELQRETESRFVLDFTQTAEDHDEGLVLIHSTWQPVCVSKILFLSTFCQAF